MDPRRQSGGISGLLMALICVALLFIGAVAFGVWAFAGRQDYKNNTDQKIALAVKKSNDQLTTQLNQQFAEKEKSPYKVYTSPQSLGSVSVTYPKTWSGYVSLTPTSGNSTLLDAYFNPNVVPGINDQTQQSYALRLNILSQAYSDVVQQITQDAANQTLTTKPYKFPRVTNIVGVEFNGAIEQGKTGTMVVVPLRNNTLEVWTEGGKFDADFNNIILKNFIFSP